MSTCIHTPKPSWPLFHRSSPEPLTWIGPHGHFDQPPLIWWKDLMSCTRLILCCLKLWTLNSLPRRELWKGVGGKPDGVSVDARLLPIQSVGYILISHFWLNLLRERWFVWAERLTRVGLWCRGNESWLEDTREERPHHHWTSLRRCRGKEFQHAMLLRVATFNKKEKRRSVMVRKCGTLSTRFPVGINWLLTPSLYTEMMTGCSTIRRNDYFFT